MTTVVNRYKETEDVYIGRGSQWGNPFRVTLAHPRQDAIDMYEDYILARLRDEPKLRADLEQLRGKRLGCFCKPKACHGDVLVKLLEDTACLHQD